jgi:glycogen phosphorylase
LHLPHCGGATGRAESTGLQTVPSRAADATQPGCVSAHWHYEHEPETRAALDLIFSEHFNRHEPGIFNPIRDALLTHGDHYMHLADLKSYSEAHERVGRLYTDRKGWAGKAILNVSSSGKFSSDRTIADYAREIWQTPACPIP